ncbi:MAG: GNAT family N-acetyltransferase [bacterium]|nr:GNAT family N-acetyltransferase [bacterium]
MLPSHFRGLASYTALAFGKESIGEPWTVETALKHIEEGYNKTFSLVAEENGELIGGLVAYPSTYEKGTELFIDILVVRSDKRGQGIGQQLFNRALELAKENDLVGVRFLSHPQLPSFNWYKKLGLKESGWREMVRFFV